MEHRGYYLEKVYFILTCGEVFLPFEESIRELQMAGISVEVFLAEEVWEEEKRMLELDGEQPMQALYVTDHGAIAKALLEVQRAVLGYRHSQDMSEGYAGIQYVLESPEGTPAEYFERVFRRYAGLPWSILETEHCYVRESCEEDVEAFYRIYKEPEVTRYTEGLYEHAVSERAYIRE